MIVLRDRTDQTISLYGSIITSTDLSPNKDEEDDRNKIFMESLSMAFTSQALL